MRLVSQITLQAPTDWRAAAFLLERRFPTTTANALR